MSEFVHKRSRDIGDTLTDTFIYIRENFKTLGKGFLFFVIPLYIIQFFLLKDYQAQAFSQMFDPTNTISPGSIFGWKYFLGLFLSIASTSMMTVITLKHINLTSSSEEPSLGNLSEGAIPNMFRFIWLYTLVSLASGFSMLLFIIPGIFMAVKLSLSFSALIIEDNSISEAISRSWELTKDHWWVTFALLIIMYIISFMVSYSVLIPTIILSAFTAESGLATDSTFWTSIYTIINAVFTAVSALTYSVMLIATSLHLYNLAERKEGGSLRSRIEGLVD